MRESIAADHPFELSELSPAEARAFEVEHDQPFKVEIIDDLLAAAERDGTRCLRPPSTARVRSSTCAVDPMWRAPGRSGRSSSWAPPGRTGAATRSADAPARLRHGLGDPGAARSVPVATRGGKKRDHRRSASSSTCSASTTSRRVGLLASQGPGHLADPRRGDARAPGRRGYQEVSTPIVVSERLWRQSGHWDLYKENMFIVESENQLFSLKPMNCPESTFIYRSHLRSYRDLPLRFSEFGRLHRNERSGTLSGLTRVRQFIQDDAHLYVRPTR
jgi:threonyl-tRNA synthetase